MEYIEPIPFDSVKSFSILCMQCDYVASHIIDLNRHVTSKHKKCVSIKTELKYPCHICERQFTEASSVKEHIKSVHGGLKHNCDRCDKQFT